MRKTAAALIVVGLSLALAVPASAYKEKKGFEGGTIAGVVKFEGTPPAAKNVTVNKNQDVCGKKPIPEQSLVVGQGGGVRWAVARLVDVDSGKAWDLPKAEIDQNGCFFHPHVAIVQAKKAVQILNNDGILHNFHTFPKQNKAANRAQPKFLKKMTLAASFFDKPEIVNVKCDVHAWMDGYIVVAAHPYYAVTGADGAFKLANVPPGNYKLEVWHETLGTVTQAITVKAKETASVSVSMKK
ncbi:MAG: carboxypeptidase regulatory-like domain-containing protein [Candidatus Tectomicrobia bacterium]|nr:carboxypeptidase regulatory-like domain-containing protein [Candidatus Tectomicrobia bacterium]